MFEAGSLQSGGFIPVGSRRCDVVSLSDLKEDWSTLECGIQGPELFRGREDRVLVDAGYVDATTLRP